MTESLRSGQLAAAAGVNVQTLRYYERRGLLPHPQRSPGRHREYGPDALTLLRIIRATQRLGFTLKEIAELLEVGSHRGPRQGLRARAQAKAAEVDAKIAHLQEIRATLTSVVEAGCSDLSACSGVPSRLPGSQPLIPAPRATWIGASRLSDHRQNLEQQLAEAVARSSLVTTKVAPAPRGLRVRRGEPGRFR